MKVELVMPLAAKGQPPMTNAELLATAGCGALGPPAIFAQPGPSPGAVTVTGMVYVVPLIFTVPIPKPFVACTANALAFKAASGLRKFKMVKLGVTVQKLVGCKRPPNCPPVANES